MSSGAKSGQSKVCPQKVPLPVAGREAFFPAKPSITNASKSRQNDLSIHRKHTNSYTLNKHKKNEIQTTPKSTAQKSPSAISAQLTERCTDHATSVAIDCIFTLRRDVAQ